MKKRDYINKLMKLNISYIRVNFQYPNRYMTKYDLILYAIAYKKMTGINLYKLTN